ncbi:MAG TPA: ABC transporter permease [Candidatus Methylomirabilis sp.]|nr:ABC transporter permease [Candidatus Methylomirabilis sp.]
MTPGSRGLLGVVFVLPGLLVLIVALLGPLALIAGISLMTYSPTKIWLPVFTGANYARLADAYYLGVTWTTVKIGLVTTGVCAVLGWPVAYFLARVRSRWLGLYMFLLVTPLMVSSVIRIFGWLVILGRQGLVNATLRGLGLGTVELLGHAPAVVVGLVELLLPFMVLPLMAAIERVPESLEEAARNLGATSWQVFRRVLLPLSVPGLVSGSLLVYSVAISALVTPALMGGRKVRMLGNLVYDEVLTSMNWPFASSLAVVLLCITGAVMVGYLRTMQRLTARGGMA